MPRPALLLWVRLLGPFLALVFGIAAPIGAQDDLDDIEPDYTQLEILPILFEARDEGPAGIEKVELWVTTDGGATWTVAATSTEESGTFEYAAGSEGRYGFYTRTIDRAAHSEPSPAPGDRPKVVVVVDRTSPVVRILRPLPEAEMTAGHRSVVIWEVSDDHLGDGPVRVAFRSSIDGRWVDVEGGPFAARGRVALPLPDESLDTAQVLVEAVDAAGNRGRSQRTFRVRPVPGRPVAREPERSTDDTLARARGLCNDGRTFYKLGQLDRSEAAYREALRLVPGLAAAHHDLGVVLYARRHYDRAFQSFRAALAGEPGNPEYRFSLGVAYYSLGRDVEALDHMEQALATARGQDLRAEILWTMARVHERAGRIAEARRLWGDIVEIGRSARADDARRKLAGESARESDR